MDSLHPQARQGINAMNERHYFEAHEYLEEAWLAETGEIRNLYKGILQAAVVYLHITRANYAGAMKVYQRSQKWLNGWDENVAGIQVAQLNHDLKAAISEVKRLGPEGIASFNSNLIKPVVFSEKDNP